MFKTIGEIAAIILIVYTLVYLTIRISPADPARAYLGPLATESTLQAFRHERGLDLPLFQGWLAGLRRATRADFGRSFYYERPAMGVVVDHMPVTYLRMLAGIVVGVGTGLALGLVSALFSWRFAGSAFAFMYAVPSFCVVVLFLWTGSGLLGLTPLGSPLFYELLAVACAALYPAGAVANQTANRLDFHRRKALHVDFLFMLHADRRQVISVVWKECLVEAAAISLNAIPTIFTAVSFAEIIFSLPGFGNIFITASLRNDLSIVVAAAVVLAVTYICIQKAGERLISGVDIRLHGL
jgi:peptide/nickel transport system permease protein